MEFERPTMRTVNFSTPRIVPPAPLRSAVASQERLSEVSEVSEISEVSSAEAAPTVIRWDTPPGQRRSLDPQEGSARSDTSGPTKQTEQVSDDSGEPFFVIYEEPQQDDDLLDQPDLGQEELEVVEEGEEGEEEVKEKEEEGDRTPIQAPRDIDEQLERQIAQMEEIRLVAPPPPPPPMIMNNSVSPPTPGIDDMPYIRYALNQITRDHEVEQSGRISDSSASAFPVDRLVPQEGQHHLPRGREKPLPKIPATPDKNMTFVPVEPPRNSEQHPDLTYLPSMLHPLTVATLALFCLLEIGGLISCVLYSQRHSGLSTYDGDGGGRYFAFEFLPQMLASLILLYVFSLDTAIVRIMPFVSMASRSGAKRSNALLMDLFPTDFIIPRWTYFKSGHFAIGSCFIVFWMSLFTIPLQSSLFQTRLVVIDGQYIWRWVTVESVAWTLVVLYILLMLAAVTVIAYFYKRRTGVKWDPTSIADIVVMLQRSNSMADYRASETFASLNDFRKKLMLRSDRLGYWRARDDAEETFYAIGEEGAPVRTYLLQGGKVTRIPPARQPSDSSGHASNYDLEGQQPVASSTVMSLQSKIYSPAVRYRHVPWFLRPAVLISWIVMAFLLLLAFLVVSFVNRALQRGFLPLLASTPDKRGFSPDGFLYSFIPSFIGLMLCLLWQSVDMRFRALQPFAKLASHEGTTADRSLLLEYTSHLPVQITLLAAAAKDYKVAWISFISLLSFTFPIIGGGLFWAIYFSSTGSVRMVTNMPGLYVLITFLVIYTLSLFAIWPGQKRHLPHDIRTLAELTSFVYQSPLLADAEFRDPKSKIDLVTRLLGVPSREREPAKYAFGVFKGRDGKEHLGVDRLLRPESDMIVTTGRIR